MAVVEKPGGGYSLIQYPSDTSWVVVAVVLVIVYWIFLR